MTEKTEHRQEIDGGGEEDSFTVTEDLSDLMHSVSSYKVEDLPELAAAAGEKSWTNISPPVNTDHCNNYWHYRGEIITPHTTSRVNLPPISEVGAAFLSARPAADATHVINHDSAEFSSHYIPPCDAGIFFHLM